MNCAKTISEEVIKESNQEYDNDLKIVNILNDIEKMIEKKAKRLSPIKLTIEDIFVVYELIRIKIINFREKIFNRDTVTHFILTVFETFFIKNDGLNFENLEEKSAIFDVILEEKKNPLSQTQKINDFIEKVKNKEKDWQSLIKAIKDRFAYYAYLFCAILNYSKDLQPSLEFIRIYLELLYQDFEIKFTDEELRTMKIIDISNGFAQILSPKHPNYFELYIKDGHIEEKLFDPQKIAELIQGNAPKDTDSDFVTQDLKIEIEEEKEEKRGQKIRKKLKEDNKNKNLIKEDNKEQSTPEEKPKANIIQIENDKYNNLLKEINDLKGQNKRMMDYITNIDMKFTKTESKLELVKFRTALKSFIDFFYRAIGYDGELPYEKRVDKISEWLDDLSDHSDKEFILDIKTLLKNSLRKLRLGNSISHKMDDNIDETNIFEYLFQILDPKKDYEGIIEKLEKIKAKIK